MNPPLPDGAAEQLARVVGNLGSQASPERYADVEEFLEKHAETFSTTERFWREVSATKRQIEEFAAQPIVPGESHIDDQGVIRGTMRLADGENRATRRLAQERSLPVRHMMAKVNQAAHARLMVLIERGLFNVVRGEYSLSDLAEANTRNRKEAQASMRESGKVPKRSIVSEGALTDELGTMTAALEDAYEGAFLGQYIGIHEIQKLLTDDQHVLPFVNRLQELAALSRGGWVEFPGLLETVQVHLVESQVKRQPDSIQSALRRVAGELYSRHVFVHSLINPEAEPNIPIAKPPDSFLGGIATARSITTILGRHKAVDVTSPEIAEHIADNLDDMPADWQAAYEAAKEGAVTDIRGKLGTTLQPFERSGRLVSNINVQAPSQRTPSDRVPKRSRGSSRQRTGKKDRTAPQVADRNLGDIITQAEAEPKVEPPTFAVLKGTGSAARKVYNIEHAGDLEDVMETSIVKSFLRGKTATLANDVQAMLRTIMEDPLGTSKTLEVRNAFRINGEGVPNVSHTLRRYSPRKGNVEGGTSHELASQVRIFFATTTIDGKRYIALENIDLRDSHTY